MSLAQENFERAVNSGYTTLRQLADSVGHSTRAPIDLGTVTDRKLQMMQWDLEAIQAAIRLELNDRHGRTDLG